MSEGDKESGNGKVVHLHPEAVSALAEHTARRLQADEVWIREVDEGVAEIRRGETDWQRDVDKKIDGLVLRQKMTLDAVMDVKFARFAWPKLILAALFLVGGFSAVLVALLLKH